MKCVTHHYACKCLNKTIEDIINGLCDALETATDCHIEPEDMTINHHLIDKAREFTATIKEWR